MNLQSENSTGSPIKVRPSDARSTSSRIQSWKISPFPHFALFLVISLKEASNQGTSGKIKGMKADAVSTSSSHYPTNSKKVHQCGVSWDVLVGSSVCAEEKRVGLFCSTGLQKGRSLTANLLKHFALQHSSDGTIYPPNVGEDTTNGSYPHKKTLFMSSSN